MTSPSGIVTFYRLPVDAPISGSFGQWYERAGGYFHRGIDFAPLPVGSPVYSPAPLDIIPVNNPDQSYGRAVAGRLPNGLYTLLAHNEVVLVSPGMHVPTGEIIAFSGNTGTSTGPHCHWQYSPYDWWPTTLEMNRDPLLEYADVESPEFVARVAALELATFGGQAGVQLWIARGQPLGAWADDLNRAVRHRIEEHSGVLIGQPHGQPYGSVFPI